MTVESKTDQQPVVEVCFGPECSDNGGRELMQELQGRGLKCIEGDCRNQCPHAPLVLVDEWMVSRATLAKVMGRVEGIEP